MKKYEQLKELIANMDKVIVAFSGGVDSTFLLKVALDTLGTDNVLAVNAKSPIRFEDGLQRARDLASTLGTTLKIIETREMVNPDFVKNDKLRCYYCKKELFGSINHLAKEKGYNYILDGTNADDISGDYRPGLKAVEEFNIQSPLQEVGLRKSQIRELSRRLNLPTWDLPSNTCLATRFAYGINISSEFLHKINRIENYLHGLNLRQFRARLHDKYTIRIEVWPDFLEKIVHYRKEIISMVRSLGFKYITLDLEGYKSGSMNKVLEE